MLKAGDKIMVQRSSGKMEGDWYLWTDWNMVSKVSGFTAPECVAIMVVKPVAPFTLEDLRTNVNAQYIVKTVTWADVLSWNEVPES